MDKLALVLGVVLLSACTGGEQKAPDTEEPRSVHDNVGLPTAKREPINVVAVFAQPKVQELSCDVTRSIAQDLMKAGKPLGGDVLLGLGACDKRLEIGDRDGIVVAVPAEDGKYFYDLIPKKAAEKATDICNFGATVAATVIAAGEENIAITLYGPGGRACDELLSMAIHDNPMLIIDPVAAIAINEARRVGAKGLKELGLYDNYQEATAELEDAAQRLHSSVNKDIVQVKNWVDEDPVRAAVYASNPMIGPIYENRIRIGREAERVPDNVEKGVRCLGRKVRGSKKGCSD